MAEITRILRLRNFQVYKIDEFTDETDISGWLLLHEKVILFQANCASFVKLSFALENAESSVEFALPYEGFEKRFDSFYSVLPQLLLSLPLPDRLRIPDRRREQSEHSIKQLLRRQEENIYYESSEFISAA